MATENKEQPIKAGEQKTDTNTQFIDTSKSNVPETKTPEITTEKIDDKTINFSDFQELLGENPDTAVKDAPPIKEEKISDKKVESTPTLETKPSTEEKEEVVTKPEIKVEQTKQQSDKRDYSDLADEDVPLFKKMGNETFNKLKPMYLEHKKLKDEAVTKQAEIDKLRKGALPDNYFEHPRGYTLTPQFENAANTAIKAGQIVEHWEKQLNKIKNGDDTYQEIHINSQDGGFYLSKPIQATKESASEITDYLKGCEQQLMQKRIALQEMATSHGNTYKQAIDSVKAFEEQAFKNFTGENAKVLEPVVNDTINKVLPPAFHTNPLARSYAKALITLQQLGTAYKDAMEKLKAGENGKATIVEKEKIESKRKAGPTNSDMAAGGEDGKSSDNVSFDMFQEAMGRR
jgi:hypothetical protein